MTDKIKEFFKEYAIIIVPLLIVILVCTYDDGTDYSDEDIWWAEKRAHEEGYNEGYNEGYERGYEEGADHERSVAFDDGYNHGYEDGYNDGKSK